MLEFILLVKLDWALLCIFSHWSFIRQLLVRFCLHICRYCNDLYLQTFCRKRFLSFWQFWFTCSELSTFFFFATLSLLKSIVFLEDTALYAFSDTFSLLQNFSKYWINDMLLCNQIWITDDFLLTKLIRYWMITCWIREKSKTHSNIRMQWFFFQINIKILLHRI